MTHSKLAAVPAAVTILTLAAAGFATGSANAATPLAAKSSSHAASKQATTHRAKAKKTKAHGGTKKTATKKAASGSKEIAVSGSFTDPTFGDHVAVSGLVRNFPVPAKYKEAYEGNELDLVQLTVTAGTKFSTGFPVSGLYMLTANKQEGTDMTDIMSSKMKAAGYKAINDNGPQPGQTMSGWAAFEAYQKNSPTLTLRYKRDAMTVLGTNQLIPAKNFDIPLVPAQG